MEIQSFQYKIINRFYPCNYVLSIWYKEKNAKCQYCAFERETLDTFFVTCTKVSSFWQRLSSWWYFAFEVRPELTESNILLGIIDENGDNTLEQLNFCILMGKWYSHLIKSGENEPYFLTFCTS